MSDQKLDNRELLNVRWAFDDPNPKSRKEVNRFLFCVTILDFGQPNLERCLLSGLRVCLHVFDLRMVH